MRPRPSVILLARLRHRGEQLLDQVVGADPLGVGGEVGEDAVPHHGQSQRLDVLTTDAMLERTYNLFSALKSNGDKVVGLLRKLGKSENSAVESLCDQIDLAADELEKAIKI